MRTKSKKVTAALLAIMMTASAVAGCGNKESNKETPNQNSQNQENGMNENVPVGDEAMGEVIEFSPADLGIPAQEKYEYVYAGLTMTITEKLQEMMENKDVVMMSSEDYNGDGSLKYAALYWYSLTEEQKNEKVTAFDPDAWREKISKIGVLGVYHKDSIGELDNLTQCTEHKEVGKSADGGYVYYLSFAAGADEELKKELEKDRGNTNPNAEAGFEYGQDSFF